MAACVCNLQHCRTQTGRQIPGAHWPASLFECLSSRFTVSKNKLERDCKMNLILISGLHMHVCMCTYIHAHIHLYKRGYTTQTQTNTLLKGCLYLIFVVTFVLKLKHLSQKPLSFQRRAFNRLFCFDFFFNVKLLWDVILSWV